MPTRRYRINVTREVIDRSGHGCDTCPTASAIRAATCRSVWVFQGWRGYAAVFLLDPKQPTVVLPDALQAWIDNYDEGRNVEPISFELEIPEVLTDAR